LNARARPRVATFPAGDAAFAAFVRKTATGLAEPSLRELERAVRTWYPKAHVAAQHPLAAFGEPLWYVYRDGQVRTQDEGSWWEAPEAGRVVFNGAGIFLEADAAAAALVGMTPDELVGRHWSELVDPSIATDDPDWLWETIRTKGAALSVFRLSGELGVDRWIQYRTETTPDPDRLASRWRELRLEG